MVEEVDGGGEGESRLQDNLSEVEEEQQKNQNFIAAIVNTLIRSRRILEWHGGKELKKGETPMMESMRKEKEACQDHVSSFSYSYFKFDVRLNFIKIRQLQN